jgi:hypothetical protein
LNPYLHITQQTANRLATVTLLTLLLALGAT